MRRLQLRRHLSAHCAQIVATFRSNFGLCLVFMIFRRRMSTTVNADSQNPASDPKADPQHDPIEGAKNTGDDELLPNSTADEFFDRMKHDFRRPKPSQEAVATALQAIQKLAGDVALDHASNLQAHTAEVKCSKY